MESRDVIVVGSGAAGLAAACVAAAEGRSVAVLEQSMHFGGTTAISGGMVWIPGNRKAAAAGLPDDLESARRYLAQTVGAADPVRMEAFLQHGDEAIGYLEQHTALRLQPVARYPDYHPDLPGATLGGRVLEPTPYDARALGPDFPRLRDPLPEFMLFDGMMISRQDIPHLRRAARSWASARHVLGLLGRHAMQRLRAHRGTTLYLGNALAARLLQSARDLGVQLMAGVSAQGLRFEGSRVAGVECLHADGRRTELKAHGGIILATGGLSHGGALRSRFLPAAAGDLSATVHPGTAARGAQLAASVGGALTPEGARHGAFWVPASVFRRKDGTQGVFPHTVTDRAKPGLIAVGPDGRRFVNEAVSYHAFVQAQLASAATPAWLLCDRRFLWKYGLGKIKPFTLSVADAVAQGYLHRANSIEALAGALGLPADALVQTVARYNQGAQQGRDPDFGRGRDAYQRHLGDADCAPNPCVAPLEQAPFYAVAVFPADLGMSAGLMTDGQARVLDAQGQPIPGLYACGNDMASVMEGAYPGPGITLGPALTFGYLAARHAAAQVRPAER